MPTGLPISFLLVVASRIVAMFGVQLSTFALSVWVFQRSGSAADYALLAAMAVLPSLLVLPFSGTLTDRWGYWRILPGVAMADAFTTAGVFALARVGWFLPLHAYVATFVLGITAAFMGPALITMGRQVVAEEHLGRSNGAMQLAWALTTLIGPAAAAALMARIGFVNVLALDAVFSFAACLVMLLALSRMRNLTEEEQPSEHGGWLEGWHATRAEPLVFTSVATMLCGFTVFNALRVLLTPFVLARYDAVALGWVMALAGSGMLVGSLAVAVSGGDRRPERAILASCIMIGLTCVVVGLIPTLPGVMAGAFLVSAFTIVGLTHTDMLAQRRLAAGVQGRATAFRHFLSSLCYVVVAITVGPAVDRVFEPALAAPGTWAQPFGAIWGFGRGCGIALLWSSLGLVLLFCLGALNWRGVKTAVE